MTKLAALSLVAVLAATTAAQSAAIISVKSGDHKTVTTITERGTTTTKISRNGNTVTATTRFVPSKPGYRPMGGASYHPTGGGGYKPMGR